ncbi:MAG: ribbon-helix-helix domain-containing protein [Pseudomonadota bacterium]
MLFKRSISLSGHATSIALEQPFWDEIDRLAAEKGMGRAALVRQIDEARGSGNLASALRVFVLETLKAETLNSVSDQAVRR